MGPVDEYLSAFEGAVRQRLDQIRQLVREEVPDGTEVLSYGIPTMDWKGRHLVHFAGFKNHIGLYPTPHGITAFEPELAPYKKAKGSVQFPHDQPLPLDLIRRIVHARLADETARSAQKQTEKTTKKSASIQGAAKDEKRR